MRDLWKIYDESQHNIQSEAWRGEALRTPASLVLSLAKSNQHFFHDRFFFCIILAVTSAPFPSKSDHSLMRICVENMLSFLAKIFFFLIICRQATKTFHAVQRCQWLRTWTWPGALLELLLVAEQVNSDHDCVVVGREGENKIQFCLYCTVETKLSRYWQRWNWVGIYGGLDIFIWIYFYTLATL